MGMIVLSRWANQFYSNHKGKITGLCTVLVYLLLLLTGAVMFSAVEGPHEVTQKELVSRAKKATLAKHPGVSEEVLNSFIEQLDKRGITVPLDDDTKKWTFGNTFLYSATLLTTVGYGHLSPATPQGKVLTMIFTTIGFPISLLIFTWVVSHIQNVSDAFKLSLYYRLQHRLSEFQVLLVHFLIVSTLIIVGAFLFPAYLFMCTELTWSYLDAVYFVFISVTTIGLGDLVPGKKTKHPLADLYRIGATVYILFGVVVAMFLLTLGTDFVILVLKFRKNGKIPSLVPEEKLAISSKSPSSYGSVTIRISEDNNNEEKEALIP